MSEDEGSGMSESIVTVHLAPTVTAMAMRGRIIPYLALLSRGIE
jgi:hypothetical protein